MLIRKPPRGGAASNVAMTCQRASSSHCSFIDHLQCAARLGVDLEFDPAWTISKECNYIHPEYYQRCKLSVYFHLTTR